MMHFIDSPTCSTRKRSLGVFLLVTVVLGGGAAWLAGRAIARPGGRGGTSSLYMLILGAAVRFIHFALFDGTLLSLHYYLVDTRGLRAASAMLGFRPRGRARWSAAIWLDQRSRAGPARAASAA